MEINGIKIDTSKLMTKQEALDFLKENGEDDRALAGIRERYNDEFGNELMWRYPISDSVHAGGVIVVVQEGFLWLPYDCMNKEDYELFELDDALMFDDEAMAYFIDDWKLFSDDLLSAMTDMLRILRGG